jgi:hypothetical protein
MTVCIAVCAYLSTLPAADIYIFEGVFQSPLMPLPAHRTNHGRRIPLEKLWRDRTPHIALQRSLLEWHRRLGQAEGVRGSIAYMGLCDFLEDLGKDFVRKVVDVH